MNAIGAAAEAADHHPDLDLRYGHLNVRLRSHDVFGITDRDVALARQISALASEQGVAADPAVVSVVDLALDTPDHGPLKPFWRTVLGYRDHPDADDEVRDDDGDGPALWFQASGSEEPRQRWHLDVRVPEEVAEQRIADAVAAGGTVVDRGADVRRPRRRRGQQGLRLQRRRRRPPGASPGARVEAVVQLGEAVVVGHVPVRGDGFDVRAVAEPVVHRPARAPGHGGCARTAPRRGSPGPGRGGRRAA